MLMVDELIPPLLGKPNSVEKFSRLPFHSTGIMACFIVYYRVLVNVLSMEHYTTIRVKLKNH